jgi:hypothetical protein
LPRIAQKKQRQIPAGRQKNGNFEIQRSFPIRLRSGQDWGQNLQQQQQQIPFGDDNQKDNCGRPERRLQARWLMLLQEDRPALLQEDRPTGPYIEALVNPS